MTRPGKSPARLGSRLSSKLGPSPILGYRVEPEPALVARGPARIKKWEHSSVQLRLHMQLMCYLNNFFFFWIKHNNKLKKKILSRKLGSSLYFLAKLLFGSAQAKKKSPTLFYSSRAWALNFSYAALYSVSYFTLFVNKFLVASLKIFLMMISILMVTLNFFKQCVSCLYYIIWWP